jgi:hypothetical protein
MLLRAFGFGCGAFPAAVFTGEEQWVDSLIFLIATVADWISAVEYCS